jgi:hypothetical protein
MLLAVFSIIVALTVTAATAQAADLTDVKGSVLVNNQAVSADVTVAPGDRIKAISGSAKIVYSNGMAVKVAPGQMAVVLRTPPEASLAGASLSGNSEDGFAAAGGAAIAGAAGLTAAFSNTSGSPKPLSP